MTDEIANPPARSETVEHKMEDTWNDLGRYVHRCRRGVMDARVCIYLITAILDPNIEDAKVSNDGVLEMCRNWIREFGGPEHPERL